MHCNTVGGMGDGGRRAVVATVHNNRWGFTTAFVSVSSSTPRKVVVISVIRYTAVLLHCSCGLFKLVVVWADILLVLQQMTEMILLNLLTNVKQVIE